MAPKVNVSGPLVPRIRWTVGPADYTIRSELTRDMDKDTALCVCRNFLLVQAKYFAKKLEPIVLAFLSDENSIKHHSGQDLGPDITPSVGIAPLKLCVSKPAQ